MSTMPLQLFVLLVASLAPQEGVNERDLALRTRVDTVLLSHDVSDPEQGARLARELLEIGPDASPYLCKLIKRGDLRGESLAPAALIVGKWGQLESLSALTRLARSDDPSERCAGLTALCRMNRPEAVPVLVRAIGDPEPRVSARAEEGLMLTRVPSRQIVKAISRNFALSRDRARLACILARIGGGAAHEALLDAMLVDELAALQGIQAFGDGRDGPRVLELLATSDDSAVRKQASLCLGALGHAPAVQPLIECLDAKDRGLASNAHWSLQRLTGQSLKLDRQLWESWWELVGSKQDA